MPERYMDINPGLLKLALGIPGHYEILGNDSPRGPGWTRVLIRAQNFPQIPVGQPIPAFELNITDERTIILATAIG